jgi:cytochrome c-type biogenesis protein CcmH/NrfG
MARAIKDGQMTPADELRVLLADSETFLAGLRGKGAAAVELLENMDRISEIWPILEASGFDLRPESGRWETLQGLVRKNSSQLLHEMRVGGGLPAARQQRYGSAQAPWWWYLAEDASAQRIQGLRKGVIIAAAVLASGILLVFLVRHFFPVDPKVQASMSRVMAGQQKVQNEGNFESALADFQEATTLTPNDAEAWMWLGATQQKLGLEEAANASFKHARDLVGKDLEFWLTRAPIYISVGMLDAGKADLDAALALDPENPQAHFHLASFFEAQGQLEQAAAELEKTSTFSEKRDMAELTALSRYRLAMLLQQIQVMPGPTATATPQ